MLCPLCNRRKARRRCPALGRDICAVCCGTKRGIEIHCPEDCGYLSLSRSHPPAVVQRRHQQDLASFAPVLQDLTDRQSRILLLAGTLVARHVPQDFQTLRDDDIADATGTLAATLETAGRGVIYEHRAATPAARNLAEELKQALAEIGREAAAQRPGKEGASIDLEPPPRSAITADTIVVLRRLEQTAREMTTKLGGGDTGYRDLLVRLLSGPAAGSSAASPHSSGLIVP